jgi:hypothetical protein
MTNLTSVEEEIQQFVAVTNCNVKNDKYSAITNSFKTFFTDEELDQFGMAKVMDLEKIKEKRDRYIKELSALYHRCKAPSEDPPGDPDAPPPEFRVTRLIEYVDHQYELIFRWMKLLEDQAMVSESDGSFFRLCTLPAEEDDLLPLQKLILYMLDILQREKYSRYKGFCCKEIGSTKAWKSVIEIKDFVYTNVQKETKYDMWKNSTQRSSNITDCIKFLTVCCDIQFPEIKKNRNVWSFNNGIYDGSTDTFYKYGIENHPDKFVVSCKYFDLDFPEETPDDWYEIETPYFQSILNYQNFPEEVQRWLYVFAGRLCFDLNVRDSWQVIPFLKGIAGSGKSTIITKALKKFYECDDVKTLSNNIEKKFGLWSIDGCFAFISPEVKGDLALEQAEFQSIVSGEDISIARKNEKAITKEWKTPGILAGNEVPNWKDNSGSIQRRIVTWNFTKQVLEADPKLDEKLDTEMACILVKCVRAYLDYTNKYANQDIWNVLPKYFKEMRNKIATSTNSLHNFLMSEKVIFGPGKFVPQKVFVNVFMSHCGENNLMRPRGFGEDIYAGPFSSRDLEVRIATVSYNGTNYASQPVIYGVDLVQTSFEAQI